MDALREYYRSNPPDLSKISDPRFRHFRLRLRGGSFLKVGRKIRSEAELQRLLLRYGPADVYYSTGCWLNPHLLGPRSGGGTLENLFIRGDLAFDVDEKPFNRKNIEKARKNTVRLYDELVKMGKTVKYIAFSGGKGFHIVCEDDGRYSCEKPSERESEAKAYRKSLVDELSAKGLKFDEKITKDTRRIFRVPGTVNSGTGYVCTVITPGQLLRDDAGKMLKYIPRVNVNASWTRIFGDDKLLKQFRTITGWTRRVEARPHPTEHHQSNLSSVVLGTKRQITIIRYPLLGGRRLEEKKLHLTEIQSTYRLGDLLLFDTDSEFYAVSLRTMDPPRIRKALKAAGTTSYDTLVKYHQTFMRVGLKRGLDGVEFGRRLRYVGMLDGGGGDYFVSRPHHRFFRENGVPLPEYGRMHGGDEVVLTHTLIE